MTGKSKPVWQRKGFANDGEYRAACAATRKTRTAALLASNSKLGRRLILEKMWSRADFHRPFVTITKEQIMSDLGVSLSTVKRAWKELRAEGSIKPATGWQGGKGVATTFHLRVSGHSETPSDAQIDKLQRKKDSEATFRFLSQKYGPLKALEIMGPPDDE